ncbi:MAG: Re/Si-specific NAD(P)(+) transhydrogenase subunit alpha [Gemmatimonadota bacterium]
MRIAVPQESAARERRVAVVPDTVGRLVKAGREIVVQRGAGLAAGFPDADYEAKGATLADDFAATVKDADVVLKVQRPSLEEAGQLKSGTVLISFLPVASSADLLARLAQVNVTAFSMEKVPRTTRAQSMDALSSQANLAGYQAVLLGATQMSKILPMMTTAAGTIAPAKAFIIGAGVAGLQAIATARRLGAVVSAFDVRPVVKEQVQSLGALFVETEQVSGEGQGGYARELAEEQQRLVLVAIGKHIKDMDLVVSTAAIPGKPAPQLITEAMVRSMRPGAVIIDLAAETGGNCVLTQPGETVDVAGVSVIGPLNLAAAVPLNASQMYSRNVQTLLDHITTKEGALSVDLADEITKAMVVVHAGTVRTQ